MLDFSEPLIKINQLTKAIHGHLNNKNIKETYALLDTIKEQVDMIHIWCKIQDVVNNKEIGNV